MPLHRAGFLRRMAATSAVSRAAAENGWGAGLIKLAVPGETFFVRALGAFDIAPASSGKAEAILAHRKVPQSEERQRLWRSPVRALASQPPPRKRTVRRRRSRACEIHRHPGDQSFAVKDAANPPT